MKTRQIEKILTPQSFNWVGDAFLTTSFIGKQIPRARMSPFFAVGYNPDYEFTPKDQPRGVGAHPHKGFETVTIAYKGKIEHRDSNGNHGIIGVGDVQWMTAGSGLLHEEYHEKEFSEKGGLFQMVQLWVNLPARYKETPPQYQDLYFSDMTKVPVGEDGSFVNVIAGDYQGQQGKATTFSPIHLYNVYLNKGAVAPFTFPSTYNTALLVIEGGVAVNGIQELSHDTFAMFENDGGDTFSLQATEDDTIVLVMSGEPLHEPIAHYGPFVMNTEAELHQAFKDFQEGKFGTL
jgi:redox-sensitive bicupin YhaK (pirin superfamily)